MSDRLYTYAVARIRAMEVSLLTGTVIEQLMGFKNEQQCLQFLAERGWGNADTPLETEAILTCEREKTWREMKSLVEDISVFDVLNYADLFHNLKAAVKAAVSSSYPEDIFIEDCAITGEEMLTIIKSKEYYRLPQNMAEAAQQAYETLLHTGDGQLCDVIIDRAALEAIYAAGQAAQDSIIKEYAESQVAVANIKIAVRSQITAKSIEFMEKAMVECDSLEIKTLALSAIKGADALAAYLAGTTYAQGAEALKNSTSAFECWCDNQMIKTIRPQIYKPFGIGPLFAYILGRENEIKTVRIILSGKRSGLSDESIRERVREMYA